MQICKECLTEKPLSEFHKNKTYANGHVRICKPCASLRTREWYKRNTAHAIARRAIYVEDHKDEIYAKQNLKWKGKKKPRNKELAAAYTRNYFKFNRGWANANNAKRRAKRLCATPAWANLDAIRRIYEVAKFVSDATGLKYEVDHIVPLNSDIVCGLHCEANLRIIHRLDNIAKGNRYWPDMP